MLIEAKDLVNGVSIVQAESVERSNISTSSSKHTTSLLPRAPCRSPLSMTIAAAYSTMRTNIGCSIRKRAIGHPQYCAPRLAMASRSRRSAGGLRCVRACGLRTGSRHRAVCVALSINRPAPIAGWAQNTDHPEAPVCLDIFAGGRLIGQVLADRYREDLEREGLGSGRHSFEFTLPPELAFVPDEVEVRRSLDGNALELTNDARRMQRENTSHGPEGRRAVA